MNNLSQTPHGKAAFEFASALLARNFADAQQLLSAAAKKELSAAELEATYSNMIEYFEKPPTFIQVMNTLEDWPAKQPGDIGWAYVAISGESESEAVAVIVCAENGKHLVRNIEWGRP